MDKSSGSVDLLFLHIDRVKGLLGHLPYEGL